MPSKHSLDQVRLSNVLSFQKDGITIELQPLNVIVGTNGSGKSNFVETLRVLRACANDLSKPFTNTGGVSEWLNKTYLSAESDECIQIECYLKATSTHNEADFCHRILIRLNQRIRVVEEYIHRTETAWTLFDDTEEVPQIIPI